MLCIKDSHTDPYFNLAADEYVLKNFEEDCFMLWRNDPSVIVGKHQNTLAEINVDFVNNNNIKVVRRISGGGAVFHDLGNLNFSFIMSGHEGNLIDFRKFTNPILEALLTMGIEGKFEGRNDLTIDGMKFSGNAEHIWKNRTLHHGTLLFSAGISDLSAALKTDPFKFTGKAVKSIRSRVTNISSYLKEKMTVIEFRDRIMDYILQKYPDSKIYEYTVEDISGIEKLRDEKFTQWEWNFGYSPKYDFEKKVQTKGGILEFRLNVEKGLIKDFKVYGDFIHKNDIDIFEQSIIGMKHDYNTILSSLSMLKFDHYFRDIEKEEFVGGMF